jgi:hypothetical protein
LLRIQFGFRVAGGQGKWVGFGLGLSQALRVEGGLVLEHEEDGPRQFDGDDGVGLELVAAVLCLQALGQRADDRMVAFCDYGRLAKSPAQVRVAELQGKPRGGLIRVSAFQAWRIHTGAVPGPSAQAITLQAFGPFNPVTHPRRPTGPQQPWLQQSGQGGDCSLS